MKEKDLIEGNYNIIVKETKKFFEELNEKSQELDWSFSFFMKSSYEFELQVRKKGCFIIKTVTFPSPSCSLDNMRKFISVELHSCVQMLNRQVSESFTIYRRKENGEIVRGNYVLALDGFKIYTFYITPVLDKDTYKIVPGINNPDDGFRLRNQHLWFAPGEKVKEFKRYPNTLELPDTIRA